MPVSDETAIRTQFEERQRGLTRQGGFVLRRHLNNLQARGT